MKVQMENILSSGLPIRENQIYSVTSGSHAHRTRNLLRALKNVRACFIVDVLKTRKMF